MIITRKDVEEAINVLKDLGLGDGEYFQDKYSYKDVKPALEILLSFAQSVLANGIGLGEEEMIMALYNWKERYLLCWNGEKEDDPYDCACCLSPEPVSECGCPCHKREKELAYALHEAMMKGVL